MSSGLLNEVEDLARRLAAVVEHLPSPSADALLPDRVRKPGRAKGMEADWLLEVHGLYDLLESLVASGFTVRAETHPDGRIRLLEGPGYAASCTWFRISRTDLSEVWWIAHSTKFRHRLAEGTGRKGNTHAPDLALVCRPKQGGDWQNVWMVWDLKHRDAPEPGRPWGSISKSEVAVFSKFVNELMVDPRVHRILVPELLTIQSSLPSRFEWHALLSNGADPTDTRPQRLEHCYSVVAAYTRVSPVDASPTAAEHRAPR